MFLTQYFLYFLTHFLWKIFVGCFFVLKMLVLKKCVKNITAKNFSVTAKKMRSPPIDINKKTNKK